MRCYFDGCRYPLSVEEGFVKRLLLPTHGTKRAQKSLHLVIGLPVVVAV